MFLRMIALFCFSVFLGLATKSADAQSAEMRYFGFDRNLYPGDDALPVLRKDFSFVGYWLGPPPGETTNTWRGKHRILASQGFGFALLYPGRESSELKSVGNGKSLGVSDAQAALAAAKAEEFSGGAVVFLDIEEGGRLPASYHAYLNAWAGELRVHGHQAGVYCSGMTVNEGHGVTITTADDIRNNLHGLEAIYWVYNDACPPSPGCNATSSALSPGQSGIAYAAIWQIAQSPRRKALTARCAQSYNRDNNCYAPSDPRHSWFLDLNVASSPDPSHTRR